MANWDKITEVNGDGPVFLAVPGALQGTVQSCDVGEDWTDGRG